MEPGLKVSEKETLKALSLSLNFRTGLRKNVEHFTLHVQQCQPMKYPCPGHAGQFFLAPPPSES